MRCGVMGHARSSRASAAEAAIPAAALDDRAATVARTGSGKTHAARGAVEGLLGAARRSAARDRRPPEPRRLTCAEPEAA